VLVRVYAGAAAGVVGVLRRLPKCLNFTRACRHIDTSQAMGVLLTGFDVVRATLKRFESGSIGEGARFDVGTKDGGTTTGIVKP